MTRKRRNVAEDATAALLEMAEDFRGTTLMSEDTYQKIMQLRPSPIDAAISEMADDARAADALDTAAHEKISMHRQRTKAATPTPPQETDEG